MLKLTFLWCSAAARTNTGVLAAPEGRRRIERVHASIKLTDAPLQLAAQNVEEAVGAQAQQADRGGGAAALDLVA